MGRMGDGKKQQTSPRQKASYVLGCAGERLAALQLESQGYRIIETNFRCRYGEIDIIAQDKTDLVFVEVKMRRGTAYGLPEEAVNVRKKRTLLQVAAHYLTLHECADCAWRIDVVAIQLTKSGKLQEIRIYQHAITEG